MKRILSIACLLVLAAAAHAQIQYAAGFYSSDGTGHVGTWNAMTGSGGTANPTLVPRMIGIYYSTDGTGNVGTWAPCTASCFSGGGGSGTVTSVSFTGDGIFFTASAGTAVTTSGTLTPSLIAQVANCILAGPTTGANHTPTCRALVNADLPTTMTGITIDGVTPTVMGYVDATSSIQTQLNSKQATLTNPVTGPGSGATVGHVVTMNNSSGDVIQDSGIVGANLVTASSPGAGVAHFAGSTQVVTSSAVTSSDATGNTSGSGNFVLVTSPTLVTPTLGAATATSLLASGIVDGTAPMTITTGTTANLGTTYKSGYTLNQEGTAGTGVTYTLPATAVGLQYCVLNSGTTGVVNTGVLTVYPPSSSYVINAGVVNTVGGGGTHGVASGGAAGDGACFLAIDATHWQVTVLSGTWTSN